MLIVNTITQPNTASSAATKTKTNAGTIPKAEPKKLLGVSPSFQILSEPFCFSTRIFPWDMPLESVEPLAQTDVVSKRYCRLMLKSRSERYNFCYSIALYELL